MIGIGVLVLLGSAAAISLASARDKAVEVNLEEVQRRDLVAMVTASGNIRARRSVDISSDISARVAELRVEEGDEVAEGDILLRLDPAQPRAATSRAQAALSQAQAQAAQQEANLIRARRDLQRLQSLWEADSLLVSPQQLEDAETNVQVAERQLDGLQHGVSQARAALDEARDRLSKTTIRAPISGRVTRLQVEEGETVIIGTMNNPGSLILSISDLSVMEAVMEVDETDVPEISLGDSAVVRLDAFPDRTFAGQVTEIGNSSIRPPSSVAGTGQTATIDFEVVITLIEPGVALRPDLSATADIITETRENAISIPIIALTIRPADQVTGGDEGEDEDAGEEVEGDTADADEIEEIEGVFVVRSDTVSFAPVRVGITGREHFEVLSGVAEGDTVVSGPYQRVRELAVGDPVKPQEPVEGSES